MCSYPEYIFKIIGNIFFVCIFWGRVLAFTTLSKRFLPPKKIGTTNFSLFILLEEQLKFKVGNRLARGYMVRV